MPTLLAKPEELADWIGEPIEDGADAKRAEMCLRIASALVRSEADRKWAEVEPPEEARMVTLYCASRVYENREAENQSGVDNWQASRNVLEAGAYLTASEKRMLANLDRNQFGGLGTVATTRREGPEYSSIVPTGDDGQHIIWY